MQNISIELGKENDTGPCDCCGQMSRTVWGYLSVDSVARAVYYVNWTLGEVKKHGAIIDLVLGEWGDDSTPAKRVAVSIVYRVGPNGAEFFSIDPDNRPHANAGLADHWIPGRHVFGNPVAADSYAFMHAILGQDPRLAELVQASQA